MDNLSRPSHRGRYADAAFNEINGKVLLVFWSEDQGESWAFQVKPEQLGVRQLRMRPGSVGKPAGRQEISASGSLSVDPRATHAQAILYANSPGRNGKHRAYASPAAWISNVLPLKSKEPG